MPTTQPRLLDFAWLLTALALSGAWCVSAANRIGSTFDETSYVQLGLEGWRNGSHHGLIRLGTMPLPADVQTLPLYLAEKWRGQPWDLDADFPTLLVWARYATLSFWALLLAYGWRVGASLAGPWGGRVAVALLACEPNLLAHASLATTDIAITACLLAFFFHFQAGRDAGTLRRLVVPGVWLGIALVAKASALAFAPLGMLAIELSRRPDWREHWRTFVGDSIRVGLIGMAVAVVFCGSDWQPEASFVEWAHKLPDGRMKMAMVWFSEHLCIFSNAFAGLARQIKHNLRGHGTYLLGQSSDHAFWYYFPVVLSIKLTLPFLAAWAAVLVVGRRAVASWVAAVALLLLLYSFKCRVQIGIRLLLPFVALAAIGLAIAAVRTWETLQLPTTRIVFRSFAAATFAWMLVASVAAWPDGLRYVNEAWGGRGHGYVYVSDSNYDWGQGLPELAAWQRKAGVGELHVWYFGTDPLFKRLPLIDEPLHVLPGDAAERLRGQTLAAATSLVYGYGLTRESQQAAAFLRTQKPVARAGTFLIYDFTRDEPVGGSQ
ncbi:MAG: glycosyltransferase family 39 protein [Gemmataceae bacterium]